MIGLHQDEADDRQDDDGQDQGAKVLSFHEEVRLICAGKSIGRHAEDQ